MWWNAFQPVHLAKFCSEVVPDFASPRLTISRPRTSKGTARISMKVALRSMPLTILRAQIPRGANRSEVAVRFLAREKGAQHMKLARVIRVTK